MVLIWIERCPYITETLGRKRILIDWKWLRPVSPTGSGNGEDKYTGCSKVKISLTSVQVTRQVLKNNEILK